MRRNINRIATGVGIFFVAALVFSFAVELQAAPPQKDICPAPTDQGSRQTAVQAACRFFNMEPVSWGLHSAFGSNGEVITCIHFSCKKAAVVATPVGPIFRAPVAKKEDCLSFNPHTTSLRRINNSWKIVDGSHWLFDFGNNKSEAVRALKIIKRYGMNQSCYVGRPDPSFEYKLVSGSAPAGSSPGEDCVSFNPQTTTVKLTSGNWKIVDGSHWMFDFGNNESEARETLAIIKKHGFNYSCFVGRPGPSFKYLRR